MFILKLLRDNMKNIEIYAISPMYAHKRKFIEENNYLYIIRYPRYESSHFWGYFLEYINSFFFTFIYFLYFLFSNSFNLIYFIIQPSYYFLFIILCRVFNKKIVTEIWDFGNELFVANFGKCAMVENLLFSLDKFMARNSNIIFTRSKHLSEIIEKHINKHYSTLVEYNAIEIFEQRLNNKHTLYNKESNSIIILHRSMLHRRRGVLEFVEVARRYIEKYKNTNVVFLQVGRGTLKQHLQTLIKNYNLSHHFILQEFISDSPAYYDIIKEADICVGMEPATPHSNICLATKYIEYTWGGKPIIAWELAMVKEYLGKYIYFVKNGDIEAMVDAIHLFVTNYDLREKYAELSKQAYREIFAGDIQKDKILEAFEKVLNAAKKEK